MLKTSNKNLLYENYTGNHWKYNKNKTYSKARSTIGSGLGASKSSQNRVQRATPLHVSIDIDTRKKKKKIEN